VYGQPHFSVATVSSTELFAQRRAKGRSGQAWQPGAVALAGCAVAPRQPARLALSGHAPPAQEASARLQEETREAAGAGLDFGGVLDVRPLLAAAADGAVLHPSQLHAVAATLDAAAALGAAVGALPSGGAPGGQRGALQARPDRPRQQRPAVGARPASRGPRCCLLRLRLPLFTAVVLHIMWCCGALMHATRRPACNAPASGRHSAPSAACCLMPQTACRPGMLLHITA
jgi:hypothetical protein